MLEWFLNFIADEFLVVALPRVLVLKNHRLGAFYKILQIICICFVGLYCVYARTLMIEHNVEAWGVTLWREDSPAGTVTDQTLPHCQNPSTYASKTDRQFSYAPTACKALPNEEAHFAIGNKLLLATFVDDVLVWDGTGERCGAASRQACQQNEGAVYQEADGHCSCKFHEQFIVKDAEEQLLRFVYGYEVDPSHGYRMDVYHNGLLSSTASDASTFDTQFLAVDGTQCTFGGKSQWPQSEAVGGITGRLSELLACAGVTLDSDPAELVTGAGSSSSPQHLRTAGMSLTLHCNLRQDLLGHIMNDVRVEATPVTAVTWKDGIQPSTSQMGTVSRHLRRAHGVAIDAHVRGSVYEFSWYQIVRGFVDIMVLLQVPMLIVHFVAMYLMGVTSEIYRHSARTKLSICSKFHTLVTKLMLAEVAFRGLVGNFSDRIEELETLTPQQLLSRLEDVFMDVCKTGALNDDELVKMACVVFQTIDDDKSGGIGCREFIDSCTNDGEITMQRMAKYFHQDRGIAPLRRLLDDTHLVATKTCQSFMTEMALTPKSLRRQTCAEFVDVDRSIQDASAAIEASTKRPSSEVAGDVLKLERLVANLDRRLQAQEEQCEQALGLLKEAFDQQLAAWHAVHRDCPMPQPPAAREGVRAAPSRAMMSSVGDDQETLTRQLALSNINRAAHSDSVAEQPKISPMSSPRDERNSLREDSSSLREDTDALRSLGFFRHFSRTADA